MKHILPELPYARSALVPYISEETIDFHYGKHHQTYVNTLNTLIEGTEFAEKSLEEIIKTSTGPVFNNSAQVYNHSFYWNCLTPNSSKKPTWRIAEMINEEFGSFESFKEAFTKTSVTTFGAGWGWLVLTPENKLKLVSTSNAGTPITTKDKPLLTCDVWEHAYYIDVRNARPNYLLNFWNVVNWEFVNKNLG